LNAYGNPQSDPKVATKLIAYVTLHYLHVHKALKQIDSDWHAGNFKAVGTEGGQLAHDMLGEFHEEGRHHKKSHKKMRSHDRFDKTYQE